MQAAYNAGRHVLSPSCGARHAAAFRRGIHPENSVKIRRRDFLKLGLLTSAAGVMPRSLAAQSSAPPAAPQRLLVIGAGLSILLALGLDLLNRTITSPTDVEGAAKDVPLLTIPQYSVPQQGGPITSAAPS